MGKMSIIFYKEVSFPNQTLRFIQKGWAGLQLLPLLCWAAISR